MKVGSTVKTQTLLCMDRQFWKVRSFPCKLYPFFLHPAFQDLEMAFSATQQRRTPQSDSNSLPEKKGQSSMQLRFWNFNIFKFRYSPRSYKLIHTVCIPLNLRYNCWKDTNGEDTSKQTGHKEIKHKHAETSSADLTFDIQHFNGQ